MLPKRKVEEISSRIIYILHLKYLAGEVAAAVSEKVDEAKEKAGEVAAAAQEKGKNLIQ